MSPLSQDREGECGLTLQVISAAAMMIFMLIFIVMMWKISSGMKQFLSENIEEALIVSAECIGDQIMSIEKAMAEKMSVLQNENRALRGDVSRQLDGISALIADANDKAEVGVNSIVKELNYIIPAMRDEMTKLLQTLSENAGKFQADTLANLEAEVRKLINTIDTSCSALDKAAQDQSKQLASIAGTVQSMMQQSQMNIQSAFDKTHSAIKNANAEAVKQINADYQENMKRMFQAMADNLGAITSQLKKEAQSSQTPPKTKTASKKAKETQPS